MPRVARAGPMEGVIMTGESHGRVYSRRNVLKVLAGAAGVAARGPLLASDAPHCATAALEPATSLPAASQAAPQILNSDQIRTLTALSEAIIPADRHSPGAAAAGVPAFIEAVLAKSGEDRRKIWTEGLAAIDRMAEKDFASKFAACTAGQQDQLLLKISANEENPVTIEEKFFVTAKQSTIEGYYNSEVGIHKDLEYQGNTPLAEFEGCTHPEHGGSRPAKP